MKKNLLLLIAFFLFAANSWAQLTGTKTIPGNYATIAAAITSLNTSGVGAGGVTFNIAAGYTETFSSPTAGLITATGTVSNPIIFQKSGSGANPIITAGVGTTTTTDAIIKIAGGDYITFDGINLTESAANTTNTTRMEWGYALVKGSSTTPFNGCQFVTIKNCAISLNNTYTASIGIYAGNHIATATTALTITATTDAMNNCKFFNNTISNVYSGISITGFVATSNLTLYDSNNEIGVDGANTITNLGGGAAQVRGIFASNQKNLKVANNVINSSIAGLTTTGYGIFTSGGTSSNIDIYNNTITLTAKTGTFTSTLTAISNAMGSTAASNTVNIYNNTISNCNLSAATTGNFNGITNTGTAATVNIYGNTISGDTLGGSGSFAGIYNNANMGSNPLNFYSNTIANNAKTGGSGNMYCTQAIAATIDFYSNNIHDNSATGTTTFYGYYNIGAAVTETYRNNTIYNLTHNGTGTLCAFQDSTSSGTKNIFGNTIYALSSGGNVSGLSFKIGAPANIYKNNIYNITTSGATTQAIGINYLGGSGNIYNNFISDIKATTTSNTIGVIGINLGGNTQNLYYNTIYLNASSSATTFGSAGIYKLATTIGDFRNNIIVNNSIAGSTGLTTAFRLSGAYNATYYAATSNSNCFYAGIPSTSNLIFYDGTNANQTIADFKALVTPRDTASFIENPPFINDTSAPYNLHILPTLTTGCESAGIRITTPAISDDFDGNIRWGESGYSGDGTATDIGADEFDRIPIYTCTTPNPGNTVTSANNLCLGYSTTLSLQNLSLQTGISYQWKSSADGVTYTNILGATASTYIATLLNATYYKCDVNCKNGPVTSSSTPIQNLIYPLPSDAGTIMGTPSLCKGSEGIAYSVPSINGASSYTWSYSGTGATISGTSNNITISFSSNSTSGILTVKGHNFCGDGIVSPDYTINISSLPENAGTITGFDTVCQGQNNIMYTVAKITNATSYIWTLPSGVTGLSSTDTIILNYGSTAVSGELTVCGNNTDCGNGASSSLAITINPLPESAASISGTAIVYQGQSGATYSIPSINNANGYVWSVPSGVSIVSGNNTNSITVNYSDTIVSGIINVYGRNDCGNGISSPNFAVSSCIPPTIQATAFTSTAITTTSLVAGWTRGSGNSVLVIARRDSPVNANPENGIIYNADSVFGNGSQIGTGNFVVYNGTGTSIKISSLIPGTKYYFAVYEYNSASNCYLSPALTDMVTTTVYCLTDFYTHGCSDGDYFSSFNIGSINQTGMICSSGTAGYNDFTYLSTSLVQGGVYPINGVTVYGSGENLRIWIDYNDDGYFDNTTEVCYSNPAVFGTLSDNFILPISATPGIHRMRVRLVWNNIGFNACEHKEYGCINDYTISIQMALPCSGIPNPGNTLSSLNSVCPTDSLSLSLQNNVSAIGISYQWQSSNDSILWNDIIGGTNAILTTSQSVSKYYRCVLNCVSAQNTSYSNPVHITMNALASCYCIPPVSYNPCTMWISKVTSYGGITNINNISTCSSSSYTNFCDSNIVSNSQLSTTTLSFTSTGNPMAFSVWIDYNGNGSFEPSERVIANNNTGGLLTIHDIFTIPIFASPGIYRMRVRGEYYMNGAPANPCDQLFSGETEDYTLTVIAALPCSGMPNPGNTLSSLNSVCPTDSFLLSLQNNVSTIGIFYQWQSSSDSIIWTDIIGDTNAILITSQTVSKYYRCVLSCLSAQSTTYSNPIHIIMNALISCYCIPPVSYNPCTMWISKVTSYGGITNINNSSTCASSSYTNFSSNNLSNWQLAVNTLSFTSSGNPFAYSVWIDFDDNGSFELSERVIANNNSSGSFTISDIFIIPISATPGTHRMRVRGEYYINGAPANPCSKLNYGETEDYTFTVFPACTPPTIQASSLNYSAISSNSMTIGWTRGNGNAVLVVARKANAVNTDPINGSVYPSNAIYGSGMQIGSGNYVIYNGIGNEVNFTGLSSGTTYHYAIYEYDNSTYCYKKPALTGNLTTNTDSVIWLSNLNTDTTWIVAGDTTTINTHWNWIQDTSYASTFFKLYVNSSYNMKSPTANNGVYYIDGITNLVNGIYGYENSTLTLKNPINTIGHDAVKLKFYQLYKSFNHDSTLIEVSNDNISWHQILANPEITNNGHANNYAVGFTEFNISQWAANKSQVWIRFRFIGPATTQWGPQYSGGYGWMIDDISITYPANNILSIDKLWLSDGYTQIPIEQNGQLTIKAKISNNGLLDQTNVKLKVKELTNSSIFIDSISKTINHSISDTLILENINLPNVAGDYYLSPFVSSDSINQELSNILYKVTLNNNHLFSRDYNYNYGNAYGNGQGFIFANRYLIKQPTFAESINFVAGNQTTVNSIVKAVLYRGTDQNKTLIAESEYYTISANEIPTGFGYNPPSITLSFLGLSQLIPDSVYWAGIKVVGGNSSVTIAEDIATSYPLNYNPSEFFDSISNLWYEWYVGEYYYPMMIRLKTNFPSQQSSIFNAAVSNAWENAANWDHGVPSAATFASIAATKLAIVNSNNYQCKNLTIAPLGKLTINAGKDLRIIDTLILQSNASGTASLIDNGTLFSSTNIVERYIPHTFIDEFHMLSSPVISQAISPVFNEPDGFFVWNEAIGNWIEYADAANFAAANGGSNFIPAKGYAVSYPTATTKSFIGNLNTGTINIPLSVTAGLYSGWNFIANPYPSAINWNASSGWNRSLLENADPINHPNEKAIWVWNAQAANYGAFISNTDAATNGVSRNIALSQGFWVKATTAGSLSMNNEVREHADQAFLKSSTMDEMIRLKVTSAGNTYSDELIVSFGNISNQGGAEKMFSIEATAPSIYSCKLNKKWSISNLTSIADNATIPVGFKPGIDGDYTISAMGVQAFGNVMLEDLKAGTQQNLSANNNYSFNAQTSDNENRFLLHFMANSITNMVDKTPSIYFSNQTINIFNPWLGNTMVNIFDVNGKLIQTYTAKEGNSNYYFNPSKGVYVIKLQNEQHVFVKKEVVY